MSAGVVSYIYVCHERGRGVEERGKRLYNAGRGWVDLFITLVKLSVHTFHPLIVIYRRVICNSKKIME